MPKMNNYSVLDSKPVLRVYSIAFPLWTNKLSIAKCYFENKKSHGGYVDEVIEKTHKFLEKVNKEEDSFDYKSDNQLIRAVDVLKAARFYKVPGN